MSQHELLAPESTKAPVELPCSSELGLHHFFLWRGISGIPGARAFEARDPDKEPLSASRFLSGYFLSL